MLKVLIKFDGGFEKYFCNGMVYSATEKEVRFSAESYINDIYNEKEITDRGITSIHVDDSPIYENKKWLKI